jgi:hypothetical protein
MASSPKDNDRSLFIVANPQKPVRQQPDWATELEWLSSPGVAHAGY